MKPTPTIREKLLKQFLSFFWLRPENGLLVALRAEHYFNSLNYFKANETSLDVSCGDGVFSFITLGGELSENTDMFRAIRNDLSIRLGNFDTFDHFDDSYTVEVTHQPKLRYGYGSDWKSNLLEKAKKLDFYKTLLVHDNNFPLPLKDKSFEFIYSNSSYWIQNFDAHLTDLARLLKPGGTLILESKTNNILKYTSPSYLPFMSEKFHSIVDAGRFHLWKGLRSRDELFNSIEHIPGLNIESVSPVFGPVLGQIWDIGLRPLFNPLSKMANCLDNQSRLQIKREWCGILYELFHEYILGYECSENDAFEFLLQIRKSQ